MLLRKIIRKNKKEREEKERKLRRPFFDAGNATYKPLCQSFCLFTYLSVCLSVITRNISFEWANGHYCPCPTARDRAAVYTALFFSERLWSPDTAEDSSGPKTPWCPPGPSLFSPLIIHAKWNYIPESMFVCMSPAHTENWTCTPSKFCDHLFRR